MVIELKKIIQDISDEYYVMKHSDVSKLFDIVLSLFSKRKTCDKENDELKDNDSS